MGECPIVCGQGDLGWVLVVSLVGYRPMKRDSMVGLH